MAHMIEENRMAWFGKTPWHGLGVQLEESDLYSVDSCIQKSGMNWEVERVKLQTTTGLPVNAWAIVRTEDNKVLADAVGERFRPLQNRDAFQWFQPFLDTKEAALHTCGVLDEGRKIWILAKINRDPIVVTKDDEVEKYLLLSHSHDGTLAVRCGFTPQRVVCWNTLSMAHGSNASKLIKLKHTQNLKHNLENIRETINIAEQEFTATAEQYKLLVRKDINQKDLYKYVKLVFDFEEEIKDLSTKSKNILEKVIELFETGRGNTLPGVRNTYWAAYNGISEYLTWQRGRTEDSRLNSLWFGPSANTNQKAMEVAVSMAA